MVIDEQMAQRLLATHTPQYLQQYVPEFIGNSPDSSDVPPLRSYGPYSDSASLVGSFMMYCSACCYLEDGSPQPPDEEG